MKPLSRLSGVADSVVINFLGTDTLLSTPQFSSSSSILSTLVEF